MREPNKDRLRKLTRPKGPGYLRSTTTSDLSLLRREAIERHLHDGHTFFHHEIDLASGFVR